MTDDVYGAADLRGDVEEGERFFIETILPGDATVEEIDVDFQHDRIPPGIVPSDSAWAFTAREADSPQEWHFIVDPESGGPNRGVVYCFWDTSTGLGGHHEVYPRAFHFPD